MLFARENDRFSSDQGGHTPNVVALLSLTSDRMSRDSRANYVLRMIENMFIQTKNIRSSPENQSMMSLIIDEANSTDNCSIPFHFPARHQQNFRHS